MPYQARNKLTNRIAALIFAAALTAPSLIACAPQAESNPYGSKDATGELRLVIDDTLEARWNAENSFMPKDIAAANLENITFATPTFCDANGSTESIVTAIKADSDADMVFARGEIIDELIDADYIKPNTSALNTAEIPVLDNVYLVAARASGSSVDLPQTRLVGGKDDAASNEWRLSYLPNWSGRIAVGPETSLAGQAFNQALASVGLYSEASGQGGSYADSIANKISVVESSAEALANMSKGLADIAFVYTSDIDGTTGVESFYEVPTSLYSLRPNYKGAVLAQSQHADAARWYLNVLYQRI